MTEVSSHVTYDFADLDLVISKTTTSEIYLNIGSCSFRSFNRGLNSLASRVGLVGNEMFDFV